ncbi:MAG: FGGY-family carbohydrate kinase [Pseudomonadota bacterium]
MKGLSLGIDLGTSGIRTAVVDGTGAVLSMARADYPGRASADPDAWWAGVSECIARQIEAMRAHGFDPARIARIGVDGTSGTLVLTDARLRPVTRALMYNDGGFTDEAAQIASHAPDPHITRGPSSALARLLRLQSEADGAAAHALHQADFIAAKLMRRGGLSDHNNALKTGYDPETEAWPSWFGTAGVQTELLPQVRPAGAALSPIDAEIAAEFGVPQTAMIHAGTTDSIAAFLAAAPLEIGAAVTSLGTTLAVKILSQTRIDAPEIGLYAHRIGGGWLVGGASNSGGGVLAQFFSPAAMSSLSAKIDPDMESPLDYYPLAKPGERFPINDPAYPPRLTPRPSDDAAFLHGLFEGIARIEAQCYAAIEAAGGPRPKPLLTAGGGAQNPVFTALRERVLGRTITKAVSTEAAIGTAKLVAQVP